MNTNGDKINLKYIMEDYYFKDYECSDRSKVDILEQNIHKLEKNKKGVKNVIEQYENLKNLLEKEKNDTEIILRQENEKFRKLCNFNLLNLNEYDKLNLINADSDIDLEKYINNNDYNINMDKENILREMEELKSRYEERSKKFKDILRKLKKIVKEKMSM
jgi:hypothetical protein